MARTASLLQALGSSLVGFIGSAGGTAGVYGSGLVALQQCLGGRWISGAAVATEAASASSRTQSVSAPAMDASATPQGGDQTSTSDDRSSFNVGFRRVVSERRAGQHGVLEGIIHIQNTFNNIILTLTDKQGAIKTFTSAGVVGFRGARKSQPVAAERAAEELAKRALKLGYTTVDVRLKGPGSNKQYAVQSLAAAGLQITSLADVTPIPYNGCRLPKKRRV